MHNVPTTFQRLMSKVLSGVVKCEAYLDDDVVYLPDCDNHIDQTWALYGPQATYGPLDGLTMPCMD